MLSSFKDEIKIKIEKTIIASVDNHPLCLKRISRRQRCMCSYEEFKNLFKYEDLDNYFPNGLVVYLINEEYFNIMNSNETVDKFL